MSTQTSHPATETNGHDHKLPGVRTYRGRNLEELIPQIREDLGPDAMILRQREEPFFQPSARNLQSRELQVACQ